jgi:selenium metabolism protein YedF
VSDRTSDTVFAISSDRLGRGDKDLGRQLMARFVQQLQTQSPKPHAMLFYNAGVRLLANGSRCLDGLQNLEHEGTDLLACGTCIDHYRLRDQIAAGRITDMREIVAAIQAASKVVTL